MEAEGVLSSSVQATAGPAFLENNSIRVGDNSSDEDEGWRRTRLHCQSLCHSLDFVQRAWDHPANPRSLKGKTCPGLRQMGFQMSPTLYRDGQALLFP